MRGSLVLREYSLRRARVRVTRYHCLFRPAVPIAVAVLHDTLVGWLAHRHRYLETYQRKNAKRRIRDLIYSSYSHYRAAFDINSIILREFSSLWDIFVTRRRWIINDRNIEDARVSMHLLESASQESGLPKRLARVPDDRWTFAGDIAMIHRLRGSSHGEIWPN